MICFRLLLPAIVVTLLFPSILMSKAQANELFGKSIIKSYTQQITKCVNLRCRKHGAPSKRSSKLYISKNGKQFFSYTKGATGELFTLNKPQYYRNNVVTQTIRGNSFIVTASHATNGAIATIITKVRGNKCSIKLKLTAPGARFKYSFVGPVQCSVYDGNIFK